MKSVEFQRWLERNPDVKRECKVCNRPLGKETLMNGLDAHQICLRKRTSSYNPKAIHAGSPYRYSNRVLGRIN